MRVVITGSRGAVGSALTEDLGSEHELICVDKAGGDAVIRGDLSDRGWRRLLTRAGRAPAWERALTGADAIIHLAADPDPHGGYRSILWNNMAGTHNLLEAAHRRGVRKIVFASSLHTMMGHVTGNLERDLDSNSGNVVDAATPYFPITTYGLSKVFGELAGKAAVARGRVGSFVAVRVGWFTREEPVPGVPRTRWVGLDDLCRVFRAALENPLDGYHVVYAMTPCKGSPVDLESTERLLFGYRAKDGT